MLSSKEEILYTTFSWPRRSYITMEDLGFHPGVFDLFKAYDSVSWGFLNQLLLSFGL